MNSRNLDIVEHILRYCDEIEEANSELGNSIERLRSSSVYKNSVSMCILQIGELVGHLSNDFKVTYSGMPWNDMRRMRNIAAHHYDKFDVDKLWETITEDIPALREYSKKILSALETEQTD